ncbi:MAG: flagellar basal body rod protein FlgB [Deltaproteobacteria bacterium]|nr:flagellar basal body rod protein FlgB [Deltaproteobacteria bacterium]
MAGGLFDNTMSLLGNALDLRASRQKLLASNIANQETPGYRAVDLNFENELKKRESGTADTVLVSTSPRHIPIGNGIAGNPLIGDRATEIVSYDKNSVGIEGEMVRLSENSLNYNISAKMLKTKFNLLMTAIKEGGR